MRTNSTRALERRMKPARSASEEMPNRAVMPSLARRASRPSRSGFTLVELMVALALALFILGLFSYLMVAATGSVSTMKGISAADQSVRATINVFRRDLANVYLSNGTVGELSPSDLFTGPERIASRGFITIEENDRSHPQGIDAFGAPVELDTDDVIGFVVGLDGRRPDNIFYGKVAHQNTTPGDAVDASGNIVDFGEYMDSRHNFPALRFDSDGNSLYTSRFAEVWFYLRPMGRQHNLEDSGVNPDNTGSRQYARPALPPLYTLYRRQLLVADDARLNPNEPGSVANNFVGGALLNTGLTPQNLNPATFSNQFYADFDLSARRAFNPSSVSDPRLPPYYIHINTLADLSRRENRFGVRQIDADGTLGTPFVMRSVPLSHEETNFPALYWVHDYNRAGTRIPEKWYGRPTLTETTHPDYPFWTDNSAGTNVSMVDADDDGVIDAYSYPHARDDDAGVRPRRVNEDILLTHVVSMDIKVLEDLEYNVPRSQHYCSASTNG